MTILEDVVQPFKLRKNEKFFSRAQCIALSPDEKQIMVGTNLGNLHCGSISHSKDNSSANTSYNIGCPIYDIVTEGNNYIVATDKGVQFYQWSDIESKAAARATCAEGLPVYSVCWKYNTVVLGGENGMLTELDPASGAQIRQYVGHKGSVNVVKMRNQHTFISGGYDGDVRMWDRRTGTVEQTITPSAWSPAARSNGTHITALDVWDDFIVCGGGPNLALWYLQEENGTAVLDMGSAVPSTVQIHQDTIIVGSDTPYITHWHFGGQVKYKVSSSLTNITSLTKSSNEEPMLLATGSPAKVDVFIDFGYLSHSLDIV